MRKSAIVGFLSATFLCGHAYTMEQFVCTTDKHTVAVDRVSADEYQYTVWNRPKTTAQAPDLVIRGGRGIVEGTGVCRHARWVFDKGNVRYVVATLGCTEAIPPQNTVGDLSVFIDGKHKKTWWCTN